MTMDPEEQALFDVIHPFIAREKLRGNDIEDTKAVIEAVTELAVEKEY